uniref:Uncharacterized protein n=1 Tax=Leersia perrieri TaxID=77586 RepID=A0A0D9V9N2_9ORYZ
MGIRRKHGVVAAGALAGRACDGEGYGGVFFGESVVRTPPQPASGVGSSNPEVFGSISSEPTLLEAEADVDDSTALVGNTKDAPLEIGEAAMI